MKKNYRRYVLLFAIVGIGLFLRLFLLGTVPYGFHGDEVDVGYEGKFILQNGIDTYGNTFPLSFDRFGDFRPTGIFYLAGISQTLLGVNPFAVRFPSAIGGALTIILIYFLAVTIFQKPGIGLMAAFFLSIAPWHVTLSRATSESIIALCLIGGGSLFLLQFLETQKKKHLLFACALFFVSYYFYHIARLLVPLIVLFFFLITCVSKQFASKRTYIGITFLISLCIALILIFGTKSGGRVAQVSFMQLPDETLLINALANADGNNYYIARFFHNKVIYSGRFVVKEYLSYFSSDFLFIHGGFPLRYQIPEQGLFFITQIPMILYGLYLLILNRSKPQWHKRLFVFYLYLIAPLPAALTFEDTPNVVRASFLIIPFVLICAYGFYDFFSRFKHHKNIIIGIVAIISIGMSFEFSYFVHQYFIHVSQSKTSTRDDGALTLMRYVSDHANAYDTIFIDRNINPLFYLFITQNFDSRFRFAFNKEPKHIPIGKVHFVAYTDIDRQCVAAWALAHQYHQRNDRILMVDGGICPDGTYTGSTPLRKITEIWRKDYTKAFTLYTFTK